MIISNITKSEKKDGYEVKISFGKYPERIFWCKDKNNIIVRQKRLQKLRCRLRDLIKEFMNIRVWFPEQESASAEKMVCFLFQYDKVNMEKTICDFLHAAESEDWDGFHWQYFSQLEWIGSASVEEIENQSGNLYFTKYYKKAIQELMKKRDLEAVLFLRMLMETGIRSRDVYLMEQSCIEGKRVRVRAAKFARPDYYQCPDGSFPRISKSTLFIAETLDRVQGQWFTKPYDFYVRIIHKVWYQQGFSSHLLRQYRIGLIRQEYSAKQKQCVKSGKK